MYDWRHCIYLKCRQRLDRRNLRNENQFLRLNSLCVSVCMSTDPVYDISEEYTINRLNFIWPLFFNFSLVWSYHCCANFFCTMSYTIIVWNLIESKFHSPWANKSNAHDTNWKFDGNSEFRMRKKRRKWTDWECVRERACVCVFLEMKKFCSPYGRNWWYAILHAFNTHLYTLITSNKVIF